MAKILQLSQFRDTPVPAALTEVGQHWHSQRGQAVVPIRSQIDPSAIADHLEHVFLLERIAVGHARFRLAGAAVNDVLGMDVRGMPLSALFEAPARARLSCLLEECFQRPAIVQMDLTTGRRRSPDMQLMMWPMRSDLGDVSRALGALVPVGRDWTLRTARRLRLLGCATTPLVARAPATCNAPQFVAVKPAITPVARHHGDPIRPVTKKPAQNRAGFHVVGSERA